MDSVPPAPLSLPPPTPPAQVPVRMSAPVPRPTAPVGNPGVASQPLDPLAAVMSYLIPGLGQIYQGRVGKGLLFFIGLYLLFFYGMWMGQWRNVWLPDVSDGRKFPPVAILGHELEGIPKAVAYRPQFLGQFWVGIAAWPALIQYVGYDEHKESGPVFGTFERTPPEGTPNDDPDKITLNKLQRDGDKRWDLGWVYTVIAGVLNLLVIYDALAGPMFRDPPDEEEAERPKSGNDSTEAR